MSEFRLDDRLRDDSDFVTRIGLCELRLMKDGRWPWLVLVPQRPDMTEVFDLTPLDQTMLTFETALVAEALKEMTGAWKMNVAALGNMVRQLHVHVIARREGDPNWPAPIWSGGAPEPREAGETQALITRIRDALAP